MKNIISSFILLVSISSTSAMEIQCSSQWEDVLVVLKKSPTTNRSYLLFLGETELEKYYPLEDKNFIFSNDGFSFSDEGTSIEVNFNLSSGVINSTEPLFRQTHNIALENCLNILREDKNTP